MTSLLKFGSPREKQRGLLALYILHSLCQSSKSGYDLRKEIEAKTRGMWVPSKGTLYPVLHRLEEEHLVAVAGTGKRSRQVYETTARGEETLEAMKRQGRASHRQMEIYRHLILEIFGCREDAVRDRLQKIHAALRELPPGTDEQAAAVLDACLLTLARVS
jgi:DNA-binding PadR family transcriptional regulator